MKPIHKVIIEEFIQRLRKESTDELSERYLELVRNLEFLKNTPEYKKSYLTAMGDYAEYMSQKKRIEQELIRRNEMIPEAQQYKAQSPQQVTSNHILRPAPKVVKNAFDKALDIRSVVDPYIKREYPNTGQKRKTTEQMTLELYAMGYGTVNGFKLSTGDITELARMNGLETRSNKPTNKEMQERDRLSRLEEQKRQKRLREFTTQYKENAANANITPSTPASISSTPSLIEILLDTESLPAEALGNILKEWRKKGAI